MGRFEFLGDKIWWLSTAERFLKSFAQGYLAFWFLAAGLTNSSIDQPNADAFDLLFTWDNVKAGIVTMALSLAFSIGSTPLGPDANAPSLVVTETRPTQPTVG